MKKKALSLLLALTMCLTALLPAAALTAEDAQEQTQPVSEERQENAPAGGQNASVSEGPEAPAPGEEQPDPGEEQEDPASGEDGEEQSASEEEQPAAAPAAEPALLAAANGIAVPSGETGHTAHRVCGDTSCTNEMHTNITDWKPTDSLPNQPGNYYLTQDVTVSSTWTPANGTVLCLNGCSITAAEKMTDYVITVGTGKTLTLCDCAENQGKITRESMDGGGVEVNGGTFNLYGGIIRNNMTAANGGGVYVDGSGVFNLYGGSITKNCAGGVPENGGGVYVKNGSFNMSGGSITDNYPAGHNGMGGGVYVAQNGAFTMTGGEISKNRVAATGEGGDIDNLEGSGGGVYVAGGTFTMSGGTICGNTANNRTKAPNGKFFGGGGGVYVAGGKFTVFGDAYIAGNKAGETSATATAANNVFLATGTIISKPSCSRVQKERRTKPRKGGKAVDAEQMKKLLELLEQALKCEQVATITITIKPNHILNRQQMATFLRRTLQYVEKHSNYKYTSYTSKLASYSDYGQVKSYAREPMAFMNALDLVKGTSATTLSPNRQCTIEQAVVVAERSVYAHQIGWYQATPVTNIYNYNSSTGEHEREAGAYTSFDGTNASLHPGDLVWVTGRLTGVSNLLATDPSTTAEDCIYSAYIPAVNPYTKQNMYLKYRDLTPVRG